MAKQLIDRAISIIGKTDDNGYDCGSNIYKYLNEHNVDAYFILIGEIFSDYDQNLLKHHFMDII